MFSKELKLCKCKVMFSKYVQLCISIIYADLCLGCKQIQFLLNTSLYVNAQFGNIMCLENSQMCMQKCTSAHGRDLIMMLDYYILHISELSTHA